MQNEFLITKTIHTPVLLQETLKFLDPAPGKVYIDATVGLGGHSEAILKILNGKGAVYGLDADPKNLEQAQNRLTKYHNAHFYRRNFEALEEIGKTILAEEGRLDGILFDLGLSSPHVDDPSRGFSFKSEGPLDMRFDPNQEVTAADIVNTYSLQDLISIFQHYGEEKHARKIAQRIIEYRRQHRFETTSQLADFIENMVSGGAHWYFKKHPATRVFQALRIAANREVEVLHKGLIGALEVLSKNGRIVVISYHSIEDRIVKNFFREGKKNGALVILTKKPVCPSEEEVHENPRSRSAKFRAAEKI